MSEKLRFYLLCGLLIASIVLLWYANTQANDILVTQSSRLGWHILHVAG